MLVKTYDQKGNETGQTRLPADIFNVKLNSDLVHQVAVSQMSNKRTVTASTKDRAQVRGGGKKPWRQKGTGRARHGSRRSPLWKGGGVTFGPTKERNFQKKINKKMRRKALFMVLSAKVKSNLLVVLEKLSLEKPKTKLMAEVVKNLPVKGSFIVVLPGLEKDVVRATRNIPGSAVMEARNLNVLDLLSFKYLIMPKEGIKTIKETFK